MAAGLYPKYRRIVPESTPIVGCMQFMERLGIYAVTLLGFAAVQAGTYLAHYRHECALYPTIDPGIGGAHP
ncbi:MAG: hypothetical protein AMXMBFR84_01440 [Candidatus Hydrogenedentota bacterium]